MVRAVVYVITFLLGFIGNVLVLVVLKAKGRRRTINDIFIINLATSDLTFIFFIPILIYKLYGQFIHSLFFCHLIPPLMTTTYFVSVFTLTSMAIHRCRAILHPFLPEVQRRTVYVWIASIWLLSVLVMVPYMIVSTVDDPPFECTETWPPEQRRIYTAALMVLQFLLPMIVISCAYALICIDLFHPKSREPTLGSLYQHGPRTTDGNKNACSTKKCKHSSSKKRKEDIQIVKTLAVIVILFAVCLLPGQLTWMLLDFGSDRQKKIALDVLYKIYIIFAVFHSCWNPIIYGTLTRQFRRGYMRYMRKIFCLHSKKYSVTIYTFRGPVSTRNSRSNSKVHTGHSVNNYSDEMVENSERNDLTSLRFLMNGNLSREVVVERLYCAWNS